MNNYPDFSQHGYQVIEELGHNSLGGRVTYQGKQITQNPPKPPLIKAGNMPQTLGEVKVVIKQFQFAQLDSNWGEYQAHEQEIKLLQQLNHPGIPHYLDSFQTEAGFCLVQEYKNAQSLANIYRNWKPQELKKIALSLLEILVYLQGQKPSIIHRDIKPENILIDEENNVYLVDFGFARSGGENLAVSSVVKGSMGFMPPEQLFNRELSNASDLYGLGATLICLLTGTKSTNIGSLVDANYCFHFRHLIPPQERGWLNWLEKMVEPNPNDRYQSAEQAFQALEKLDVNQLPRVRLSGDKIDFDSQVFQEKLTATVTITNPIPNTVLSGKWEVAPHPSDPPHTPFDHSWLSFTPHKFENNKVECQITADTSKLLADKTYQRQILLRTNSEPETYPINIQVKTAPLPKPQKPHYLSIGLLCASYPIISLLMVVFLPNSLLSWFFIFPCVPIILILIFPVLDTTITATATHKDINKSGSFLGVFLGAAFAIAFSFYLTNNGHSQLSMILTAFIGLVVMIFGAEAGNFFSKDNNNKVGQDNSGKLWVCVLFLHCLMIFFMIFFVFLGLYSLFKFLVNQQIKRGIAGINAAQITLLTGGVSLSLGIWIMTIYQFISDFPSQAKFELQFFLALILSITSFVTMLYFFHKLTISQPRKFNQLIAEYEQNQEQLIKS